MHYIVTGAAGFIGGHLIRRLSVLGHTVSAVDIQPIDGPDLRGVTFYQKDVCEFSSDGDGLNHHEPTIDGVFHLAAISGIDPTRQRETVSNNVMSMLAVAEFCGANDVPLVFTSSGAVYAAPGETLAEDTGANCSAYGLSKAWGEQLIRLKCVPGRYRIVRLSNVYGVQPRFKAVIGRWIERLQHGEAILIDGDGSQARDFVAVHDVVDALVQAMAHRGPRAVDVATGKLTSITELAVEFGSILGLEILTGPGGPGGSGRGQFYTPRYADIATTEKEIGWVPKTDLVEGLAELFRSYGFPTR